MEWGRATCRQGGARRLVGRRHVSLSERRADGPGGVKCHTPDTLQRGRVDEEDVRICVSTTGAVVVS